VRIGLLQRHATDWLMTQAIQPFQRAPASATHAVVGGGPAGLSCAHRLAMLGQPYGVRSQAKLSGLNEYGIAAYKTPHQFAQRESFHLASGGSKCGQSRARARCHVGCSAQDTMPCFSHRARQHQGAGYAGEDLAGVRGMRRLYRAPASVRRIFPASGRARLVAIGGGNTAVDIASADQAARRGGT